ncbi:MAG: cyclic nucleotide-binding domain-containing protein [Pseudomonadota bacterium]
MIADSTVLLAFSMGLASAVSLPLGTLTTLAWKPSERVVALLMAFGGGALLAALTIDLVGNALDRGDFMPLAVGCLMGGLLFDALNHVVNGHGGFLRKSSTMVHHLQRQRRRRFRHILKDLARVQPFRDLPADEAQQLASKVRSVEFDQGEIVYEAGDPSDTLYIVDEGAVALRAASGTVDREVVRNEGFGVLPFFTATPYRATAAAARDSRVWALDGEDFAALLANCPVLAARTQEYLEGAEVADCLRERFGMDDARRADWLQRVATNLPVGGGIPEAVDIERDPEEFELIADHIGRFPIFAELSSAERDALAAQLFLRRYRKGEAVFKRGEAADRLFIVEHGEIALVKDEDSQTAGEGDAFGGMSFLTRACHAATAVATADSSVWVLRRSAFDKLLHALPQLGERVRSFLDGERVTSYLSRSQHFDPARAARWTEQASRGLAINGALPPRQEMASEMRKHTGAPVAIWLGITLDGIPESLVIGASLVHHSHVTLSLLAGLFLSNYPEALSSSVGMRQQGMSVTRVLIMWSSVTVMTGLGAALGSIFFAGAGHGSFALVQGIAAGAMLTMIAETMLPEAYARGGPASGYTTLLGFLAAIFFRTLE